MSEERTDTNPGFLCTVSADTETRLDRYIAGSLKLFSRSQIKARKLKAKINGKTVKLSRLVKNGDNLELFWEDPEPVELIPEKLPLDIIYEDQYCAVINKAQGMVVHPGAGNRKSTLANALLYHALNSGNNFHFDNKSIRPGIVHRLDKDTSGLIIIAWDDQSHAFLADQFKQRKVTKTYAAIVKGTPQKSGRIETFICRNKRDRKTFSVSPDRGKPGVTRYKLVKSYKSHSLLLLRPKTGRTHQLRVHLKALGHPIIGDPLYGEADKRFPHSSLMLHAKRLSIILPNQKTKTVFRSNFPPRFCEMLEELKRK